jgi:hypothetical protein
VFGKAYEDTLSEALDRGSQLLEQATMESLFEAGADLVIRIDDVIAELIDDEVAVARDNTGPLLRVARPATNAGR